MKMVVVVLAPFIFMSAFGNVLSPAIGQYGTFYFMRRGCSVQVPLEEATFPDVIKRELDGRKEITFKICFFKQWIFKKQEKKVENVVTHPVLGSWWLESAEYRGLKVKDKHFNKRAMMGAFETEGIVAVAGGRGLPINEKALVNVHYHDDDYSPNNALINYDRSRSFAKFWLVVLSPFDLRRAFVGLIFVALTGEMSAEFERICDSKNHLEVAKKLPNIGDRITRILKGRKISAELKGPDEIITDLETNFFAAIADGNSVLAADLYNQLSTYPQVNTDIYEELLAGQHVVHPRAEKKRPKMIPSHAGPERRGIEDKSHRELDVRKKVADEKVARKKILQQQIKKMEDSESWSFFPNRRFTGNRMDIIRKLEKARGPQQGMAQSFMKRYNDLQRQLKALG